MPASNADIAKVFDEIADLLEIQNENAFRIRAYRNAAQLIEGLGISIAEMVAKNEDLTELPGIGKDLAKKIGEVIETGTCAALEEQRQKLPPTITTLLRIPGLGPKRVQTLYRSLDISTLEQLYAAVKEGKVSELPGFGEKTQATLLQALGPQLGASERITLFEAAEQAEPLQIYLTRIPGVKDVVITGSYRRFRETVGDLDIVVTASDSDTVMERFCAYSEVAEVKSKGDTRSTVILASGLQVDLRVVPQESFGAALHYFTGSKTHNVAIRRIAQQRGLKVNEYGVFQGQRRVAGDTEQSVFEAVGLPFIASELRENRGEIEAAQAGSLPTLVALADLRGDLRTSPNDDAGLSALRDAAKARGWEYLAVTLHTRDATPAQANAWLEKIARLNDSKDDPVLLTAISTDITEAGTIDNAEIPLDGFDLVIASIRTAFTLPRTKQTRRILQAVEHPRLTMLAHATGRRVNDKPAYDVDVPQIVRAVRERSCWIEIDSRPSRLDPPDAYCRLARDEGVLVAVTSHARHIKELDYLAHGLGQARRGWTEAKDIVNTRSLGGLRKLIAATQA